MIFGLLACAHLGRGPAQVKNVRAPLTCSEVFKLAFDLPGMQKQFEVDLQAAVYVREYLDTRYSASIRDFMRRSSRSTSCDDELNVENYAKDIQARIDEVKKTIEDVNEKSPMIQFVDGPIVRQANAGEQLACLGTCEELNKNLPFDKAPNCSELCHMNSQLRDLFFNSIPLQNLTRYCFLGADAKNSGQRSSEFVSLIKQNIPAAAEMVRQNLPAAEQSKRDYQATEAGLSELQAEYVEFKKARIATRCAPLISTWKANVEQATARLTSDFSSGSGFYVRTLQGRFLVTAGHVSKVGPTIPQSELSAFSLHGTKYQKSKETFAGNTGSIDLGRDIIFRPAVGTGAALSVIGDTKIPKLGQKFYISGFPGVADKKFTTYACSFVGFGPRLSGEKDAAYVVECPGRPSVAGISGGPAVDEQGRVWGVISSQSRFTSYIFIAPLSADAGGKLKIGIWQTFVSDLCLKNLNSQIGRCEIMPNLYEESVP